MDSTVEEIAVTKYPFSGKLQVFSFSWVVRVHSHPLEEVSCLAERLRAILSSQEWREEKVRDEVHISTQRRHISISH